MGGSFDAIDYNLRPNKSVERKLIFDAIARLGAIFTFANYRYIGFGSLWFVDHALAHKLLRIDDLISMEFEQYAARASFNRPYKCVRVISGQSTAVLGNKSVDVAEKDCIVWLDYDGILDGTVVDDTRLVCGNCKRGSFIFVTVNAHRGSYIVSEGEKLLDLAASVKKELGALVPEPLPANIDSEKGFASLLASTIFDHCERTVRTSSGNKLHFLPLCSFRYKDGTPMITVGGIVCDDELADQIRAVGIFEIPHISGTKQFAITLPILTKRERAALNRLLPHAPGVTGAEAQVVLQFPLADKKCKAYSEFYRFYPNYAEVAE